jgi:hypothetical protein
MVRGARGAGGKKLAPGTENCEQEHQAECKENACGNPGTLPLCRIFLAVGPTIGQYHGYCEPAIEDKEQLEAVPNLEGKPFFGGHGGLFHPSEQFGHEPTGEDGDGSANS